MFKDLWLLNTSAHIQTRFDMLEGGVLYQMVPNFYVLGTKKSGDKIG